MINKVFDYIINKMGTSIGYDFQWTSKSCKDIFAQKLGNYYINVGVKCSCFHLIGCIVRDHHNVPIA